MMNVLWDLDGTLTDPKEGIIKCIQYALQAFGKTVPEESQLLWCIGPSLKDSFQKLAPELTSFENLQLVEKYRERFAEIGLYENEVYPGIPDLLQNLGDHEHFVATSKPHVFAKKIIEHFNLSSYFSKIYGAELDGTRSDKADLIEFILNRENLDRSNTYMIGDRKYDILGAQKMRIKSIGVTWGYGGRQELEIAGANFIFETILDLKKFLISKK